MAVLAAFTTSFRGFLTVVGKVAATVLAAFATCFGGALGIILEIAPAVLAAFATGLGGALGIIFEIAAAVLATLASDLLIELFVMGSRSCIAAFFTGFVDAHLILLVVSSHFSNLIVMSLIYISSRSTGT
jgi:hypothetical protein